MNTAIFLVLVVLFVLLQTCYSVTTVLHNVWPHPSSVTLLNHTQNEPPLFLITPTKQFSFPITNPQLIPAAEKLLLDKSIARYQQLFFFDPSIPTTTACPKNLNTINCITQVSINFENYEHNVETYRLQIMFGNTIFLYVSSVVGAMRGLETISQLISTTTVNNQQYYFVDIPQALHIDDTPRFPWRGLLIDTSRHYLSISTIQSILDIMSFAKFNILHWHIIDAQSFPLQIDAYPKLSQNGAYAPSLIYTQKDMLQIQQYANERGIEIVVETDMPGHSASFGKAYPEVVAHCPSLEKNVNNIPLNPANSLTYSIVEAILQQVSTTIRNSWGAYHLGGDEIVPECWLQDKTIQEFMKQQHFTSADQVLQFFENKLQPIYRKYNLTMVCWQELLLEHQFNLPKDTIVQAWIRTKDLISILQQGYRGILSAGYYLDQQTPNNQQVYSFEDTWKIFYNNEPYNAGEFTEEMKQKLLGVEASMWGEQVDDNNVVQRIFPRALAVAERGWSPIDFTLTNVPSTPARLEYYRCNHLVKRGYKVGPVLPGFCKYSYKKNSK